MNLRSRQLPPVISKPPNIILPDSPASEMEEEGLFNDHGEDEAKHGGAAIAAAVHVAPVVDPNMVAMFTALAQATNPIGKLPTFSGSASDMLPEEFIKKFNTYARVNHLTEQRKLNVAGIQLSGVAETWFNDLPDDGPARTDWSAFSAALVSRFTVPNADMNYFSLFTSRKQKKFETVEDYAEELKKMIKKIRNKSMVSEVVQVTTFINGLVPHLKRTMDYQGMYPNTLVEAVLNAKRIENANATYQDSVKSEAQRSQSSSQPSENHFRKRRQDDVVPVVMAAQVITPASAAARPQRDMSKIVCNRCKQPGHFADSCPTLKEITCYKCQKRGHYASTCTNERVLNATGIAVKEERKDSAIRAVSSAAHSWFDTSESEDFKATVHIGDVRTNVIIDSGASRHCMSDLFYNRMDKQKYPLSPSDLVLRNAAGATLKVLGTVTLPVEFNYDNAQLEQWKFYVIDGLTDNVLVGREDIDQVTLKNGITIKKGTNLVRMVEAVTVPPQSVRMVNIVSDQVADGDQILEPSDRNNGQIARCVVNAGAQTHLTNVVNVSANPIHLAADEIVGQLESVIVLDSVRDDLEAAPVATDDLGFRKVEVSMW